MYLGRNFYIYLPLSSHLSYMVVRHKPVSVLSARRYLGSGQVGKAHGPLVKRWNIHYSIIARFVDIHVWYLLRNLRQIYVCGWFTFAEKKSLRLSTKQFHIVGGFTSVIKYPLCLWGHFMCVDRLRLWV